MLDPAAYEEQTNLQGEESAEMQSVLPETNIIKLLLSLPVTCDAVAKRPFLFKRKQVPSKCTPFGVIRPTV
jgi:hypothetical protein